MAANFQIGDLIILEGPLGAGKTRLAQSIGKGLLVKNEITSPTFVIAKNYLGRTPFIHADAYRLLDSPIGGLQDLDLDVENEAVPFLKDCIELAEQERDYVSRDLFAEILASEEEHVDWLETQLSLLKQVGEQNFIQSQM